MLIYGFIQNFSVGHTVQAVGFLLSITFARLAIALNLPCLQVYPFLVTQHSIRINQAHGLFLATSATICKAKSAKAHNAIRYCLKTTPK